MRDASYADGYRGLNEAAVCEWTSGYARQVVQVPRCTAQGLANLASVPALWLTQVQLSSLVTAREQNFGRRYVQWSHGGRMTALSANPLLT